MAVDVRGPIGHVAVANRDGLGQRLIPFGPQFGEARRQGIPPSCRTNRCCHWCRPPYSAGAGSRFITPCRLPLCPHTRGGSHRALTAVRATTRSCPEVRRLLNSSPVRCGRERCGRERRGQVQDKAMSKDEVRDGVELTNLDQSLFEGANATKRDLVEYLDAVRARIIPGLTNRPLSVIRVLRGQAPFMQKNLPKYTPPWVPKAPLWAESSKREVTYGLCNDRRTLLWFANQCAVEYHPTLFQIGEWDRPTHLVLDIDPPDADAFALAVAATQLARQALAEAGLEGSVKTSGAKGLHVFVPIRSATTEEVAAATR